MILPTYCAITSFPTRLHQLKETLETIRSQVDRVYLYWNDDDMELHPGELADAVDVDVCIHSTQAAGDLSAVGKFWWQFLKPAYILVIDDDILYPPDYAEKMIAAVEMHERRAVVGVHGSILNLPCKSYYGDRRIFHFANELDKDTPVDIIGTGCIAYYSQAVHMPYTAFWHENTDVPFAMKMLSDGVPLIAVQRDKDWMQRQEAVGETIWHRYHANDEYLTEKINSVQWLSWYK